MYSVAVITFFTVLIFVKSDLRTEIKEQVGHDNYIIFLTIILLSIYLFQHYVV
jgi:hypothetical protein